jgi:hypothetical protein
MMSEVPPPETVAAPQLPPPGHWGPLPKRKFAIALAVMLSERPVHGTSIQSGAQHDGRD